MDSQVQPSRHEMERGVCQKVGETDEPSASQVWSKTPNFYGDLEDSKSTSGGTHCRLVDLIFCINFMDMSETDCSVGRNAAQKMR